MIGSKLVLAGTLGLVGAGAVCPLCGSLPDAIGAEPGAVAVAMATVPADTAHVKLAIEGMTCGSCATTAKIVLSRAPGVLDAYVSYEESTAEVVYDASVTGPAEFIAKLEEMTGYKARVVEADEAPEDKKPAGERR